MIRALHLLDTLCYGGAERLALRYAEVMNSWNIRSIFCGKPTDREFLTEAEKLGEIRFKADDSLLKSHDVIFIHSNRALLKFFWWSFRHRRTGSRQVFYIQHLRYPLLKFFLVSLLINRACTGFISVSPLSPGKASKFIRVPIHRISNFHLSRYTTQQRNGVRNQVREELGIALSSTVVAFSGILRKGKGLEEFLKLAEQFHNDPRYVFVVIGSGPESYRLHSYPYSNLIAIGTVSDVDRYLLASDSYCFLSVNEMMPLALIEAIDAGLPIGALRSPVADYLLDLTFDDTVAIAEAIRTNRLGEGKRKLDRDYAEKRLSALLPSGRKKILHIQIQPKMTGVQKISLEIMKETPDDEYEKYIIFSARDYGGDKTDCERRFREANVTCLFLPELRRDIGWYDIPAFFRIFRICRKERFDVVHTHSTKSGIIGRIAARVAGVPKVIHTVHGIAFHRYVHPLKRHVFYVIELLASLFSDRIVLVSDYYRALYRPFGDKITVIPNGIDYKELSPFADIPVKTETPSRIRLLFVGRLDRQKDPLTLLESVRILIKEQGRGDVFLTLVGDGELIGKCRAFIHTNGLDDHVRLAGWHTDPVSFYRSHDIFCLSSLYESFGLCFLEAGYFGLPVIATRVEGVPGVVVDGVTGFLVPPADPVLLARKITELLDDQVLRKKFGQAGRAHVLEKFTAGRMARRYLDLYR